MSNSNGDYKLLKSSDDQDKLPLAGSKGESGAKPSKPNGKMERTKKYLQERCGYPVQVYFILGNEFCERFSYYGMHTILTIYLMSSSLKMDKDKATEIYHAFNMLCYFSPILGAIIADSFWGKYKTILYVSLIYALGNIVVAFTSVPSILSAVQLAGPMIGLVLIAVGTGGIKPCVSAFGGDQFEVGQERQLQSFFSIFYFAINFGSLISMLITPILRGDVQCFGSDCYPLAFGVPALLMIVSLLLFIAGSPLYKKNPPEGNIVVEVMKAVGYATSQRLKHCKSEGKKEHWMDWAEGKFDRTLISDIKALFRVLFMFLPLPVFWTLFDQQGSRWTLQAMEMNGDIGVFGTLKPDQMQALNPVFVMILIPLFETVIYPIGRKCKFLVKPLQRMSAGMLLAAISFVIAGLLQTRMENASSVANMPATGYANFRMINAASCPMLVKSDNLKGKEMYLKYHTATEYFAVPLKLNTLGIETAANCSPSISSKENIKIQERYTYTLVIGLNHSSLVTLQLQDQVTPLSKGRALVRFVHTGGTVEDSVSVKVNKTTTFELLPFQNTEYHKFNSKQYNIRVSKLGTKTARAMKKEVRFGNGGIYTVVIQPNLKKDGLQIFNYEDVTPRPVSILWQIPQYVAITCGEVLFSVTGLEFAYSQSPPSMKSCIMAAWLLTVSVGNLIVVILAGARLTEDMAKEFFFFSGFLAVIVVVFSIMAYFYKYVNYGSSREEGYVPLDGDNAEDIPLVTKSENEKEDEDEEKPDEGKQTEKEEKSTTGS